MTQRVKHCPNSLNLDTVACEKYITRLLQKEKFSISTGKQSTTAANHPKKVVKQSTISTTSGINQNQLVKARPNVKQQNLPSPKPMSPPDALQSSDDSALVEFTVKGTNPRQRSRSTVADREPWGQLLKQHRSSEKVSVFSNFDPLRTLHFLAKELQHHLQSVLPDDSNMQQMVNDMQYALKRVPPEVASIIHLQQAIDLLPGKKNAKPIEDNDKSDKQTPKVTYDKILQTDPSYEDEDVQRLQKVMEDSTMKLEISCRQMESLCEQLRNDKHALEQQLREEREEVQFCKKKIEDLEFETNEILNPKIKMLEEEKQKLEVEANEFIMKVETQSAASVTELKTMMSDLKTSKSALENECNRLKHQLRIAAIEKEKYIAVLGVRDRQISEIRSEMTQLQEVVNEQLMELHNNAFGSIPSNTNVAVNPVEHWNTEQNKEHIGDIGDTTLSSVNSNEDVIMQQFHVNNPNNNAFKDIPCGDTLNDVPQGTIFRKRDTYSVKDYQQALEKLESQTSIRSMFNELKKTAYELAGTPQNHS